MVSDLTGQWMKFKDSAAQSCLVPCSITVKVFLGQSLSRATQGCLENRPFNRFWFTNDVIGQVTAGCKIPKVDNFYTKMLLHIEYILLFSRKTPWTILLVHAWHWTKLVFYHVQQPHLFPKLFGPYIDWSFYYEN